MPTVPDHLECPLCGELVGVSPIDRVIVDKDTELVDDLVHGRLNEISCPACGHSGIVPTEVYIVSKDVVVGYMQVEVPANRRGGIAKRLERGAKSRVEGKARTVVCFGPRQLRSEVSELTWPRTIPQFMRPFENAGTPDHRRRVLERLRKTDPEDASINTRLGMTYHEMRRYRDARRALYRAIDIDPNDTDALFCLASVELDDKKPEAALRWYDRLVSTTHDILPRYLGGIAAFKAGQFGAAVERLATVVNEQNDHVDGYIWLAKAQVAHGNHAEAIGALRHAAEHGLSGPDPILQHKDLLVLKSDVAFKAIIGALRTQSDQTKKRNARTSARLDNRTQQPTTRKPGPNRRT
jgi:cytochrome c-type biogenesis protein CcmH/NrfG